MAKLSQVSFAKGEVSPALFGRTDTDAYKTALKKARNCIIHSQGGVSNRAGFKFTGRVKDHTKSVRVIKFQFKTDDTYGIEVGDLYMRFVREGGHVLNTANTVSGATQANPCVVTATGHTLSNGDDVYITGIVGMTELNGNTFTVANAGANTFELTDQVTGANVDSSAFTAYGSAGTAASVYEIATPYLEADLFNIKFVQDADVITLTHPSYAARDLTRTGHTAWTLTVQVFEPGQAKPTAITVTPTTPGAETESYKVTAINEDTNEESLPGLSNAGTASASATAANPVVVTAAGHPFLDGDIVEVSGYNEMTEVNGRQFIVANKATNTFELKGENGSGYAAETTGGTVHPTFVKITNGNATRDNVIAFTAAANAQRYRFYREENGIYGYIGESELPTFQDALDATNITADLTISPPQSRNPFLGTGNYPSAVSFYEQRHVFGGTDNSPDRSFFSQTGRVHNMSVSVPSQADDAITTNLNAEEVNEIRHYVAGDDLIAFTSGGEWKINAGDQAFFAASTIKQKIQSGWGSSHRRPLKVGNDVLFVPESGVSVRSFSLAAGASKYGGIDISRLAEHLFSNVTVVDWCFVKTPEPLIVCIMSDGTTANVTYDVEQEVIAWTTWDTLGKFKSCTAYIPDDTTVDDVVFAVTERNINGNTVKYIESLASRRFTDVRDCFFVDSGLSLDSPVTISGATAADPVIVSSTGHNFSVGDEIDIADIVWTPQFNVVFEETQPDQLNYRRYIVGVANANDYTLLDTDADAKFIEGATQANPVVVTSQAHGFSDGDIIGIYSTSGMTELNGVIYKVANKTTDTFELTDEADVDIDGSGFTAWTSGGTIRHGVDGSAFQAYVEGGTARETAQAISGLHHLVGETVVVLADGNVVEDLVVSSTGVITLQDRASRVHVGLRYIADMETLDVESYEGRSILGKQKQVTRVTMKFRDTRGLLYGPNVSSLVEMKQRELENYGAPTDLLTGVEVMEALAQWNDNGRMFFRQKEPLPLTILALIPDVESGD